MSPAFRWRRTLGAALLLAGVAACPAQAQTALPSPPQNSELDAPLFYQLLIGEIELRAGEPGAAYQIILDAARRTKDDALFRRAVEIALQARAGDQALSAAEAWRGASPLSLDALRMQLQILSALNKLSDAAEPLSALLELTPANERGGLIAALPRFLQRGADTHAAAELLEGVLKPYLGQEATRTQAQVAIGRSWLAAGESAKALKLAQQAQAADPAAPGPALLAFDLLPLQPEADHVAAAFLKRADVDPGMRLAYVRALTNLQRYAEAANQLELVTRDKPDLAAPYLSLGALYLELHKPREGEKALLRYVELMKAAPAAAAAASAAAPDTAEAESDSDDEAESAPVADSGRSEQGLTQAWLLLSQAAEQRGDFKAAETWLKRIDDPKRALDVQARRASILAHQGKITEARELIRKTPERSAADGRAKLVAEAGLLRDTKHWKEAYEVLGSAVQRQPDDTDLLYEQAMMAEKLDRVDDMERLLRRVIELKPDHAQAHNALGYSLADRSMRLPEARTLIRRALDLQPGDPFITDSLGWVEYRLGNRDEALRLLRQAYHARPDPEIAAHLGEVLWAYGERDEARRVWQEARGRDAANDVLRETLARLKVTL